LLLWQNHIIFGKKYTASEQFETPMNMEITIVFFRILAISYEATKKIWQPWAYIVLADKIV